MDIFFNLKVYENMRKDSFTHKGTSRASKNMLLWIKSNLLTDAMM